MNSFFSARVIAFALYSGKGFHIPRLAVINFLNIKKMAMIQVIYFFARENSYIEMAEEHGIRTAKK